MFAGKVYGIVKEVLGEGLRKFYGSFSNIFRKLYRSFTEALGSL